MVDHAAKSFEIRTARQYLDELLRPAYAEFREDRLSSRKAITCAIFAWHLRDWVWAQNKGKLEDALDLRKLADFDSYLFTNCPELSIIQELATGSKHFERIASAVQSTGLSHGHPIGLALVFTQSHLMVKTDTLHRAENIFKRALAYWEAFFTQYALL